MSEYLLPSPSPSNISNFKTHDTQEKGWKIFYNGFLESICLKVSENIMLVCISVTIHNVAQLLRYDWFCTYRDLIYKLSVGERLKWQRKCTSASFTLGTSRSLPAFRLSARRVETDTGCKTNTTSRTQHWLLTRFRQNWGTAQNLIVTVSCWALLICALVFCLNFNWDARWSFPWPCCSDRRSLILFTPICSRMSKFVTICILL